MASLSVYSKVETLKKFPFVDLQEKKFLLIVRPAYPENGPFKN